MAYKIVNDDSLTSVANAIRVQGSISGTLEFPDGFVSAIQNLSPSPTLQTKTKTYTPTTSQQTESVVADSGYDGLSSVGITVNAMPSGTAGTPTATKGTVSNHSVSVTPSVTNTAGYISGGTKTGTAVTVSASELVSGSETKTANGTYDVTNLANLVVNVSGGGGGDHDAEDGMVTRTISGVYENSRVTTIGNYAFQYCSSLTAVSFPNATSIGSRAFQNCTMLTTASFLNVTSIGNYAFNTCKSLTTVSFPNATSIGAYAFQNCLSLTTVSFPNATSIGGGAFSSCSSLTTVSFPNATSIGDYAFINCSSLTTASFPRGASFGNSCFRNCHSLESLYVLASSVAKLGTSAFVSTPMSLSSYLGYFGSIYVPASLVNSYKTATNWSAYSARITAYEG